MRASLERELAEVARDGARDEGWVFMGPVRVEITTDPKLRTGRFEIDAELREAPGGAGFGSLVDEEGRRYELGSQIFQSNATGTAPGAVARGIFAGLRPLS